MCLLPFTQVVYGYVPDTIGDMQSTCLLPWSFHSSTCRSALGLQLIGPRASRAKWAFEDRTGPLSPLLGMQTGSLEHRLEEFSTGLALGVFVKNSLLWLELATGTLSTVGLKGDTLLWLQLRTFTAVPLSQVLILELSKYPLVWLVSRRRRASMQTIPKGVEDIQLSIRALDYMHEYNNTCLVM